MELRSPPSFSLAHVHNPTLSPSCGLQNSVQAETMGSLLHQERKYLLHRAYISISSSHERAIQIKNAAEAQKDPHPSIKTSSKWHLGKKDFLANCPPLHVENKLLGPEDFLSLDDLIQIAGFLNNKKLHLASTIVTQKVTHLNSAESNSAESISVRTWKRLARSRYPSSHHISIQEIPNEVLEKEPEGNKSNCLGMKKRNNTGNEEPVHLSLKKLCVDASIISAVEETSPRTPMRLLSWNCQGLGNPDNS